MHDVLKHFGLEKPDQPTLSFLKSLIAAYTTTVPWGSTCRIARKATHDTPQARARFAEAFWQDVLERGGDGTCFESNYAFFALLKWLGYEGYLTINNMGETVGCHSAIVLYIDGEKWLVDVGLPIYVPLKLDVDHVTIAPSAWHEYVAIPYNDGIHYAIQCSHHGDPNCFTLVDKPVYDATYRARLVKDHETDGLFLDKVILKKVIGGSIWRYNGREDALRLEEFPPHQPKRIHQIKGDIAQTLAEKVGVNVHVLKTALRESAD